MEKILNFDMNGTLADFYGVDGWLDSLHKRSTRPYRIAKPMHDMRTLCRRLNRLQKHGYKLNIISWLSKDSTNDFDWDTALAKRAWLKKHMPSVKWDNINIVPYGTPKYTLGTGILFDDECGNRNDWENNSGKAYDTNELMMTVEILDKIEKKIS